MSSLTCALGPDCVGELLCETIATATTDVTASFFELGPSYVWPFAEAASSGATVRILLDRRALGNVEAARALVAAGVETRLTTLPHAYVHWKVAAIGGEAFALGTGNLIQTDAPYRRGVREQLLAGTREWWLVGHGYRTVASTLRTHIERAFDVGRAPIGLAEAADAAPVTVGIPRPQVKFRDITVAGSKVTLAVSGSAAYAQLETEIKEAEGRLWVTVPYVLSAGSRARSLLNQLGDKPGVDVRLLLGQPPHPSDLSAIRDRGLSVRVMDVARSTRGHAKGVIADDRVIVGSANWSEPGLSTNDEASLLVRNSDAADYFASAFERDWTVADSLSPA